MNDKHQSVPQKRAGWNAAVVLALLVGIAAAQAIAAGSNAGATTEITEHAATEGATSPYPYPAMDTANTISGNALVTALRAGGNVLFMRHTETGKITPQCNVSNLTPRGERDAARVGKALQALAIPIERVSSSPVCRVQDTARSLGLGPFEITEDLSNVAKRPEFDLHAARNKLIATMPAKGKNVLLVSHMQSGNTTFDMIYLDFGVIIVYRPDGVDARPIARVRVDDWRELSQSKPRTAKYEDQGKVK